MSSYFGLDIGASSLKVCAVAPGGKQWHLEGIGIHENPAGTVDFSGPEARKKVGEALKALLQETQIRQKRVVVSVPESRVYSQVMELPNMSDAELSSAIRWEAEQFVPIPVEEVELDYQVVSRPLKGSTKDKLKVYFVAGPKKYLHAVADFLVEVGLEPVAIESTMVPVSRLVTKETYPGANLVVHLGASSTDYSIVDDGSLMFTYSTPSGGVAITRAIAQAFSLPLVQAEQYKRTYGLEAAQLEGKVRQAILVVFNSYLDEMKKAMEYYATNNQKNITRIILSGGGAYMPDIINYLTSTLQGVEVLLLDPMVNVVPIPKVVVPQEKVVFSVAMGLAMREF